MNNNIPLEAVYKQLLSDYRKLQQEVERLHGIEDAYASLEKQLAGARKMHELSLARWQRNLSACHDSINQLIAENERLKQASA